MNGILEHIRVANQGRKVERPKLCGIMLEADSK